MRFRLQDRVCARDLEVHNYRYFRYCRDGGLRRCAAGRPGGDGDAGGRGRGGVPPGSNVAIGRARAWTLTHATTTRGGQCVLAAWVAARPPPVRDARRWRAPHALGADPISLTISPLPR